MSAYCSKADVLSASSQCPLSGHSGHSDLQRLWQSAGDLACLCTGRGNDHSERQIDAGFVITAWSAYPRYKRRNSDSALVSLAKFHEFLLSSPAVHRN